MASMNSFKVAKKREQVMPAGRSGDPKGPRKETNDMSMPAPGPQGHPKMPAAVKNDPMFANEFSAERDLQTLIQAARIKGDKARMASAMHKYSELKGKDNAGVRTGNNTFDNRARPSKPNAGQKMDGQRGRW
jgi:hypothetical protein